MGKLKKCGCGNDVELKNFYLGGGVNFFSVGCKDCEVGFSDVYDPADSMDFITPTLSEEDVKDNLIAAWNTRAGEAWNAPLL